MKIPELLKLHDVDTTIIVRPNTQAEELLTIIITGDGKQLEYHLTIYEAMLMQRSIDKWIHSREELVTIHYSDEAECDICQRPGTYRLGSYDVCQSCLNQYIELATEDPNGLE